MDGAHQQRPKQSLEQNKFSLPSSEVYSAVIASFHSTCQRRGLKLMGACDKNATYILARRSFFCQQHGFVSAQAGALDKIFESIVIVVVNSN